MEPTMMNSRILFYPASVITPKQLVHDYTIVGVVMAVFWGVVYLSLGDVPPHFHVWSHFAVFGATLVVAGVHWAEHEETQRHAWKRVIGAFWLAWAFTIAVGHIVLKLI